MAEDQKGGQTGVLKYFFFIKEKVSSDWEDLAFHLGFGQADIGNIASRNRDHKSCCMDLLKEWYKHRGERATIRALMQALSKANLQSTVDGLKKEYPELLLPVPDLAVRLYLSLMEQPAAVQQPTVEVQQPTVEVQQPTVEVQQSTIEVQQPTPGLQQPTLGLQQPTAAVQQPTASDQSVVQQPAAGVQQSSAGGQAMDINVRRQINERILELERTLFTVDVMRDPVRYRKTRKLFLSHKALLKKAISGSVILLLTFLRQTDVDRFYHNHYRVGEDSLSQQLSHILISDELQNMVKGTKLIVRLQVKYEDYVQVRDRLGQGLNRTTSVDNLMALPPPTRHVEQSPITGLNLAVAGTEHQSCTDHDVSMLNFTTRQVQAAIRTGKEKLQQIRQIEGETLSKGPTHKEEKSQQELNQLQARLETMKGQLQTARQETDTLKKEVTRLTLEREKRQKLLLDQKLESEAMETARQETIDLVHNLRKEITRYTQKDQAAEITIQVQKEEIHQLKETNKNMADRIEELLEPKHSAQKRSVKEILDSCRIPLVENIGYHIESILDEMLIDDVIARQEYDKIRTIRFTRTSQDCARKLLDYIIRTRSHGAYVSLKKAMTSARLKHIVDMLEEVEKLPSRSRTVNLLLVGCKGDGKSSTGNTIVGEDVFPVSKKGGTEESQRKEICCRAPWDKTLEIKVTVTDTPGVSEQMTESEFKQLEAAVKMSREGFDAIVLVRSGNISPHNESREENVFKSLHRMFGDSLYDHLFMVVTGITQDEVSGFCSNLPEPLRTIKDQCLNVIALDNRNRKDSEVSKWELITKAIHCHQKHGRYTKEHLSKECQVPLGDELRIALMGITGAGKSSTANSIVGEKEFKTACTAGSVTRQCESGKREKGDREIAVVDSPGVLDTHDSMEEIIERIAIIATIFSAGLHALLLVIGVGRYTENHVKAVETLKEIFGENIMKYVVIVLTWKDLIVDDEYLKGDIAQYIQTAPPAFQDLLKECKGRYVAFDNKTKDETLKRMQLTELVRLIDEMITRNGGVPFRDSIFQEGQKE